MTDHTISDRDAIGEVKARYCRSLDTKQWDAWAMQDRVVFDNGHGLVGCGHYAETYVKRSGQWKIATSKLTRLQLDSTPPPA